MAVAAVDAHFADVVAVIELDRLFDRIALLGEQRRADESIIPPMAPPPPSATAASERRARVFDQGLKRAFIPDPAL